MTSVAAHTADSSKILLSLSSDVAFRFHDIFGNEYMENYWNYQIFQEVFTLLPDAASVRRRRALSGDVSRQTAYRIADEREAPL